MLVRDILRKRENFSELETSIADYILEREDGLKDDSVRDIAGKLYISPSSVIRFCNKVGFDGFNSFKDAYLSEYKYLSGNFKNIDANFPFEKKDHDLEIANKLSSLYSETVADCLSLMSSDVLRKCVQIIDDADIVYVLSNSTASGTTESFKEKMQKIGKQVYICDFFEDAYYSACYRNKKACFIIISYSGETPFMLRDMHKISAMKWPSIAITSYGKNTLSGLCSEVIYTSTREKLVHKLGDFSLNISLMYILDTLYACYFNLNYEKNYNNRVRNIESYEHYFENDKRIGSRHSSNPILKDKG